MFDVADASRYVPTGAESPGVRLYLSRSLEDPVPPPEALAATLIRVDERFGLLLEPTGQRFVDLFERTNGELPGRVGPATIALCEAIVRQFELADYAEIVEIDLPDGSDENRLTVRVRGSVLGDAVRLDHPIRSFIAVALARIVGRSVIADGSTDETGSTVLTFRWNSEPSDQEDGLSAREVEAEPAVRGAEPLEAAE